MVRTCAGVVAYGCRRESQEAGARTQWSCYGISRATLGFFLPMAPRPMHVRQRSADRHSEGFLVSWHVWQRTVNGDSVHLSCTPKGPPEAGHHEHCVRTE
jgi:hypothetical protein